MRLVSFSGGGDRAIRTGLVVGATGEVVDLSDPVVGLPSDMVELLALGVDALDTCRKAALTAARRLPMGEVTLRAPVPRPPKFLGIGLNYGDHVAEQGLEPPRFQMWFNKQSTCVVGPDADIEVPVVSEQVDYEGELGVVIGTRCKAVPADSWRDVVAGFTVINDVSVRDWQWRTSQFTMGKGFDTHGPCGPWIVTPDEAPDPQETRIRTRVNDEVRQDASTSQMIFTVAEMIEHLSSAFTLEPGDILATGTPAGVGASFEPPRWLRDGDRVKITIDGIGTLANSVVGPSPAPPWERRSSGTAATGGQQ